MRRVFSNCTLYTQNAENMVRLSAARLEQLFDRMMAKYNGQVTEAVGRETAMAVRRCYGRHRRPVARSN